MLEVLEAFVAELRAQHLPISTRESIDAAAALGVLDLSRREVAKSALSATLVKHAEHREVFEHAFEIFFADRTSRLPGYAESDELRDRQVTPELPPGAGEADKAVLFDAEALRSVVERALLTDDVSARTTAARQAVLAYAAIDASRPVGVAYYYQRVLRGLGLEGLLEELLEGVLSSMPLEGGLARRLLEEDYRGRADALRRQVRLEIQARLVAERGAKAVAASQRRQLLDEVDFMHATTEELARMRRMIAPLARILAARLARRRRDRRRGSLDFRATMRRSLSAGGVPLEPVLHAPRPARPELLCLADISGSVASFARFTLELLYALSEQFSNLRVIVFIDGIAEVSGELARATSLTEAVAGLSAHSEVVAGDGHSDYGNAFGLVAAEHLSSVSPRTTIIVLGDARNNYHSANAAGLKELAGAARRLYWLNPEPRAYWGSGDSIMDTYAPYCDGTFECRNLAQLKAFVDKLA